MHTHITSMEGGGSVAFFLVCTFLPSKGAKKCSTRQRQHGHGMGWMKRAFILFCFVYPLHSTPHHSTPLRRHPHLCLACSLSLFLSAYLHPHVVSLSNRDNLANQSEVCLPCPFEPCFFWWKRRQRALTCVASRFLRGDLWLWF